MASAADVPSIYDVVIDGQGYLVADTEQIQAQMGSAPVFSPPNYLRDTSNGNPDNEWFLAKALDDWSGGEGQRDPEADGGSDHKFWRSTNIDITRPGQITIRPSEGSSTAAANLIAMCKRGAQANSDTIAYVTSTNLYEIDSTGTITDKLAHGAGTPAGPNAICTDGGDIYIAGATSIRRYNGASYSTFASVSVTSIAYFEGNIYAIRASNGDLLRFDRATGEVTLIKNWLQGDGTAQNIGNGQLHSCPDGLYVSVQFAESGYQVWLYDGNPTFDLKLVAQTPPNWRLNNMAFVGGLLYLGGGFTRVTNAAIQIRPSVYATSGTNMRLVYEEDDYLAGEGLASIAAWEHGIVITSTTVSRSQLIFYDPITDAYHAISSVSSNGNLIASCEKFVLFGTPSNTVLDRWPTTTLATSGRVDTSLLNFKSPLPKRFHSIELEFIPVAGATVDIAYQIDSVDGAYTTLQANATTKTAYSVAQVGRAISVRVTINKGTATTSPVLQRIIVRAIPYQALQRNETYVLNLSGRDGTRPLTLRNGSLHTLDGLQMATNLRASATSVAPITVTDEFGTFTGYIDTAKMEFRRIRTQEYIGIVPIREVV